MPRRLDAKLGDRAYQLLARTQAQVTPIVHHNKSIIEITLVLRGQNAHQLFNVVIALNQSRLGVGALHARFFAKDFSKKQSGVTVHELLAVDDANGPVSLQHGQGMQLRARQKQICHVVNGGVL